MTPYTKNNTTNDFHRREYARLVARYRMLIGSPYTSDALRRELEKRCAECEARMGN